MLEKPFSRSGFIFKVQSLFSQLEQRRELVKRTEVDLETQLAEAELRRKTIEEERIKKLSELSGLNKIEKVSFFYFLC